MNYLTFGSKYCNVIGPISLIQASAILALQSARGTSKFESCGHS